MIFRWHDDGWRRRFAFFPIFLSEGHEKTCVWLQWVWVKDMCLYRQVSLVAPGEHKEATDA